MRTSILISTFLGSLLLQNAAAGQDIDHWETVVYADDNWNYQLGSPEIPADWYQSDFDDSAWDEGQGGFGYADNDDNTILPEGSTYSVFIRRQFDIVDIAEIEEAILHADYDDAYVAYLNGVEIGRENIGGEFPDFDDVPFTYHEAQLYQGGQPTPVNLSNEEVIQYLRSGTNTLAIQVHNFGVASSDFTSNFFLSLGLNTDEVRYGEVPEWFEIPFNIFEDSDLPIIKITTQGGQEIPDEPKVIAHMGIVDNGPGNRNSVFDDAFNGYDGQIAIEIRGASSQFFFPKKGYGFETQDDIGDNNNVELLGMPEENDWILHGPYSDKTLIRNVLTYHLGTQMGQWAPRTRYCELFINDDYRGVYILMEKIKRDKNRVDIARLTAEDNTGDELTGGYIVQVDRYEEGNSWISPYAPHPPIVYQNPNADDLTTFQEVYIRDYITDFEGNLNSANFDNPQIGYAQFIDIGSFVDHLLAIELARDVDGYRLSSFLHKDKNSNGGKLKAGPLWDFNLGFGNADYCEGWETRGWIFDDVNCGAEQPFWWDRLLEDPNFRNRIRCRWTELRDDPWQTDTIMQFIDNQASTLAESQARNFQRWPTLGTYVWPNPFIGSTYQDEIDYLKTWTTDRLAWMDANMVGECTLSSIDDLVDNNNTLMVRPNPFSGSTSFVIRGTTTIDDSQVQIFDAYGALVRTVNYDDQTNLIWDATDTNGSEVPSGMYFYLFSQNGVTLQSGKLLKI